MDVPEDIEGMFTVVMCIRAAAALQPDSTHDPAHLCQASATSYLISFQYF